MKRIGIIVAYLLCVSTLVFGQAAPGKKLAWDQAASSLAEAQAYTYKYYADGATTGVALSGVTCTGTASPYVCEVAYPAFTPGAHALTLTSSNPAGESGPSASFAFSFVVIPASPANLRIK